MVPMLDYDAKSVECSVLFPSFERELARKLGVAVAVIKTERGYHLIPLMSLFPKGRIVAELASMKAYAEEMIRKGMKPRVLPSEIDAYIDTLTSIENPRLFFDDFYKWLIKEFSPYIHYGCLDIAHIDATIRRRYTTLRISGKECKPYDIHFLHFMTPDGIPIAERPSIYLYSFKPRYRCIDVRYVLRIIYMNVRVKHPWIRIEAHRRILRYMLESMRLLR